MPLTRAGSRFADFSLVQEDDSMNFYSNDWDPISIINPRIVCPLLMLSTSHLYFRHGDAKETPM